VEILSVFENGAEVRIAKIDAGRGVLSQLHHMGLKEGDMIRVIQNNHGHLIIARGNLRLALGRGMAHKILVERIRRHY